MVLKLELTVVAIFSLINTIQCNINTQDLDTIQSKLQNVLDELGIIEELANGLDCTGILHTVIH